MKSKVNPKYQAWLKTLCHLECEGAEVLQKQGRENRTTDNTQHRNHNMNNLEGEEGGKVSRARRESVEHEGG